MSHDEYLQRVKQSLDEVSPSFCAAKWKQVTIHLQNGHTHSCHHPDTHKIPLSEIKINSSALHNTNFKKQQRKLMLEGQRPLECDYCWKVEDETKNSLSDRVYKSADPSMFPFIKDIANQAYDHDVDPSYVEISWGNICNFKCSYCAPHISSQWMEEIKKHGPYPTSRKFNSLEYIELDNKMPIPNREYNPYVEAFWEWWPSLYNSLDTFRITGGEPLLNKNTFKVLEYVIENPNPKLKLAINTNMNPPDDVLDNLIEKLKIIVGENKVQNIKLFTSAEAHGQQAEYIRFGMDYDKWLTNLHKVYKAIPAMRFTIMSTYNIMSIPSYKRFLVDMLDIKKAYTTRNNTLPLNLDIPYLKHPLHQHLELLDASLLPYIAEQVEFIQNNLQTSSTAGFNQYELEKIKRIYEIAESSVDKQRADCYSTGDQRTFYRSLMRNRTDFVKFVDEHDRRRETQFLKDFPELQEFYNLCKTSN